MAHPAIEAALLWSQGKTPSDPNNYGAGYGALRRLFEEYVQLQDFETVVAGAYASYGWMPRVLGLIDRSRFELALPALLELNNCVDCADVLGVIDAAHRDVSAAALTFLNNSVVGTSKFLHFLKPQCVPVWDSNVHRIFTAHPGPGQPALAVNAPASYRYYWGQIRDATEQGIELPPPFADFLVQPPGRQPIGAVRHLEFLLFQYAQSRN